MFTHPLAFILDFDESVLIFSDDEIRISLHGWQEHIRFGCTKKCFSHFEESLKFPEKYDCVFLGSGDYHHLSLLLLKRMAKKNKKFDVIVCDNHPDNMRYPFGIHCGSWIYHASMLPEVEHIHVLGITSSDITNKHCLENYLSPLINRKVTYWSVGKNARWLNLIGAKRAHLDFDTPDALVEAFIAYMINKRHIYLSIDKDVFGKDVVETNWDQGCFTFVHVENLLSSCRERLIGMDVTGEISSYQFQGLFKRALIKWEGLEEPQGMKLKEWQEKHRKVNRMLWKLLEY